MMLYHRTASCLQGTMSHIQILAVTSDMCNSSLCPKYKSPSLASKTSKAMAYNWCRSEAFVCISIAVLTPGCPRAEKSVLYLVVFGILDQQSGKPDLEKAWWNESRCHNSNDDITVPLQSSTPFLQSKIINAAKVPKGNPIEKRWLIRDLVVFQRLFGIFLGAGLFQIL